MTDQDKKQKIASKFVKSYMVWVVILLLIVTQIYLIWHVTNLSNTVRQTKDDVRLMVSNAKESAPNDFVNLVEERRYRYPVIDVKENKLIIPEARLELPLTEASRDLRYQYMNDRLWLSTAMAVGRQTASDSPSCDRVVIITNGDVDTAYDSVGKIKTSKNEERTIYKHKPCEIYGEELASEIADVARQLRYY